MYYDSRSSTTAELATAKAVEWRNATQSLIQNNCIVIVESSRVEFESIFFRVESSHESLPPGLFHQNIFFESGTAHVRTSFCTMVIGGISFGKATRSNLLRVA